MKRTVTIHDIAKLADVSSATVSRVLSNSSYPVSAELRSKILRIAKEQHYVPNMLGKQLKTRTNRTIGVIIPTITSSFYSTIILGVEEVARQNNYQVLLCNSFQDAALEEMYVRTMVEKQVRSLVISSISGDRTLLGKYIDMGLNVVALDQRVDIGGVCQVDFDYRKGGYMAAKHLIDNGHERISYLTAPLDRPSRKSIHEGYVAAMTDAGLEPDVRVAGDAAYSATYEFENGKSLTRELAASGFEPTAIFACNDLTAFGVIHELYAMGRNVPRDVSVMGFDGTEFGQMTTPPLTSVFLPTYEMGRLSCNMLIDKLAGGGGMGGMEADILLQPKLLQRGSVASAGRAAGG